ncbi:hypothetical protein DL93DRAFT_1780149 [Clavulina sp. PMI_390]|nr:hypothetical protein DL93DRAFT_1780149 [Clavulina sp. PMI_390]
MSCPTTTTSPIRKAVHKALTKFSRRFTNKTAPQSVSVDERVQIALSRPGRYNYYMSSSPGSDTATLCDSSCLPSHDDGSLLDMANKLGSPLTLRWSLTSAELDALQLGYFAGEDDEEYYDDNNDNNDDSELPYLRSSMVDREVGYEVMWEWAAVVLHELIASDKDTNMPSSQPAIATAK